MRILALILAACSTLAFSRPYTDVSGTWHYGLHFSPEFCVRIMQEAERVQLEFFIYDGRTGDEFIYATARGVFINFYELHFKGAYVRGFRSVPAGSAFGGRWLIYEDDTRMQEITYWGFHRITSYLIKRHGE